MQASNNLIRRAAERLVPHKFLAGQLRRPHGRFGRWVMMAGLNHGNRELIDATLDALALQDDDSFMDVGFGGGRALELAATRTRGALWGVDFSPDVVVAGTRRFEGLLGSGRLNLLTADITDLPLRDGLVSAICSTNTVYFWPDPARALSSVWRVLSSGGRLALGYSGADKMRQFGGVTRHGFELWDAERVEALLHSCGFREIRTLPHHGETTQGDFTTCAVR